MFAVPNCLSRNGSWFSAQKKRDSKGSKGIEAGWGACIDLPMHGCDDVRRCGFLDDGDTLFRDGEVLIDAKGLHILPHGDEGWRRVLSSARRASQVHSLQRTQSQDCDDSLSVASTQPGDEPSDVNFYNAHSPALRPSSRRTGCMGQSPTITSMDRAPARTRTPFNCSLSGLGIKPKSPKSGAQSFTNLPERVMSKLSLGDRALPKLTEAFPEPGSWSMSARGGGLAGYMDASSEEIAWRDREAMKAKYGLSTNSCQKQAPNPKKDIQFCNIRKIQKIGKGHTSVVWRCEDAVTRQELALKEIVVDRDRQRTSMAVRELLTTYGVDHVGVVTCHNVFYSNNTFQLVMELMDGGSLLASMRRWCSMEGGYRMTPTVVAKIARDVLGALEFLHDHLQVVHRDVKPGNILLNREGQAKLADLGIVTYPGQVQIEAATSVSPATANSDAASETPAETPAIEWIGTMTYMSPERLTGDTYSYSADIWSLGIVIVEAAVGRYPMSDLTLSSGKLEFWDLLDLVRNGECPANVLCDMGSEWESLQVFAAACLAKSHTQRPRARQLLDASFPGILAGDGDFFLDLATVAGTAALAEWVDMSLSRGGEGQQDSLQIADAQGINSKCASVMSAEEMHVDECLEEDGWL